MKIPASVSGQGSIQAANFGEPIPGFRQMTEFLYTSKIDTPQGWTPEKFARAFVGNLGTRAPIPRGSDELKAGFKLNGMQVEMSWDELAKCDLVIAQSKDGKQLVAIAADQLTTEESADSSKGLRELIAAVRAGTPKTLTLSDGEYEILAVRDAPTLVKFPEDARPYQPVPASRVTDVVPPNPAVDIGVKPGGRR